MPTRYGITPPQVKTIDTSRVPTRFRPAAHRERLYRAILNPEPDRKCLRTSEAGEYRAVLYEWNDNLNGNLAAAEIQFGSVVRDRLEREIFEEFRLLGAKLEVRYRAVQPPSAPNETDFSNELSGMRERIYAVTVAMLGQIREERVGRSLAS